MLTRRRALGWLELLLEGLCRRLTQLWVMVCSRNLLQVHPPLLRRHGPLPNHKDPYPNPSQALQNPKTRLKLGLQLAHRILRAGEGATTVAVLSSDVNFGGVDHHVLVELLEDSLNVCHLRDNEKHASGTLLFSKDLALQTHSESGNPPGTTQFKVSPGEQIRPSRNAETLNTLGVLGKQPFKTFFYIWGSIK